MNIYFDYSMVAMGKKVAVGTKTIKTRYF